MAGVILPFTYKSLSQLYYLCYYSIRNYYMGELTNGYKKYICI